MHAVEEIGFARIERAFTLAGLTYLRCNSQCLVKRHRLRGRGARFPAPLAQKQQLRGRTGGRGRKSSIRCADWKSTGLRHS